MYISQQGKNWKINGHSYYLSWNQQFAQWNLMVSGRAWGFSQLTTGGLFLHGEEGPHQDEPPPHLGSLRVAHPPTKSDEEGCREFADLQDVLAARKSWSVTTCHGLWASTGTTGTYQFFFVLILSGFIGTRSMPGPVGNIMESISGFYFFKEGHRLWPGAFGIVYVWWSVTWDGWHQWSMFVGRIIPLSKWLGSSQGVSHNKKVHLEDVPQPDP